MSNDDRVVVYADTAGEWRWRRVAGNHRTVASSGEAFSSRAHAVRAAHNANEDVTDVDIAYLLPDEDAEAADAAGNRDLNAGRLVGDPGAVVEALGTDPAA